MWIKLDETARENVKVRRIARSLGISRPTALGHLCTLWLWVGRHAPDGELCDYSNDEIAEAAQWPGDPDAFVAALIDHSALDDDEEGRRVHNWEEHAGSIKETARKRRQRTVESDAEDVSRDSPAVVPDMSRDSPVLDKKREEKKRQDQKEEERTRDPDPPPTDANVTPEVVDSVDSFNSFIFKKYSLPPAEGQWIGRLDALIRAGPLTTTEVVSAWEDADEYRKRKGTAMNTGLLASTLVDPPKHGKRRSTARAGPARVASPRRVGGVLEKIAQAEREAAPRDAQAQALREIMGGLGRKGACG